MRRIIASITLLLGLAWLTGCGHPFIPPSALQHSAPPLKPVQGRPGAPEVGVDLYGASRYPLPLVRQDGARTLSYIRRTLHAQGVGLVWNLCSPSDHSTRVYQCGGTLTPAAVSLLARQARHDGLAVEMRPLIRVGPTSGWNDPRRSWEGHLDPPSQRAFFTSLLRAETPYLLIARHFHAQAFVAGSELQHLQASPLWPWFLRQVHAICACAASRVSFYAVRRGIPAGLDTYPHFHLPVTASQAKLDRAWVRYLGQYPRSALRHASIQEISIPAQSGAYHHPEIWSTSGQRNVMVQARWFTAACRAAAYYHMHSIWFYEVNLTDNPAAPSSFPAFFEGRAASEAAIRSCGS